MKVIQLVFILVTIGLNALNAQEFNIPHGIDPFRETTSKVVINTSYNVNSRTYGFPKVRVWGWSKTGNFACSIDTYIEGKGGSIIGFYIINAVTNELVFYMKANTWMFTNKYDELYNYYANFENLYNSHKDIITDAIKKYDIIRHGNNLLPFPIQKDEFEYTSFANIEVLEEPEFFDPKIKYELIVNRGGKTKVIKSVSNINASSVYICGYFLSPFENRAMVIAATKQYGFEGSELSYNFSGFHLKRDFD